MELNNTPLVNRVAQSGIITLDLELFVTQNIVEIDLKDFLFRGLILKEKEYRNMLKEKDWSIYKNQVVAIYCSSNAIIPKWAYMLLTTYLFPHTKKVFFGSKVEVVEEIIINEINGIKIEDYKNKKVVIKGCGKIDLSGNVYIAITKRLLPMVSSLMFGEPCSTVPVYKKKH